MVWLLCIFGVCHSGALDRWWVPFTDFGLFLLQVFEFNLFLFIMHPYILPFLEEQSFVVMVGSDGVFDVFVLFAVTFEDPFVELASITREALSPEVLE